MAAYVPVLEKAAKVLKWRSGNVISFNELLKTDREKIYKMAALILPFSILRPASLLEDILKDESLKRNGRADTVVQQTADILMVRIDGLADSGEIALVAGLTSAMVKVIEDAFIRGGCKNRLYREILDTANSFMIRLMDRGLPGQSKFQTSIN